MRAAIYARVSSAKQRDEQTIAAQLRDVPAWVVAQGWTVVATYTDDGRSAGAGRLAARDGLARLVADAEAGLFDVVAVAAIDRLTRSEDPVERAQIIASITATGCKLAVIGAGIQDPGTFAGDAYVTLQALFAAEWRRGHRARVKAGKLTAIARGRKPSGPTPYGYHYDRATGAWSIDPAAGPVVREIVDRVIGGSSCYSIAVDLDARQVPTVRGGRWSPERVWSLARSPTYLGRWVAHRARGLAVPVPALVTAAEHDAVRTALARHRKSGLRRTRHVYLLEGVATCSRCGAPIGIASATRERARVAPARYVCCLRRRATLRATPADRCGLPYHDTATVDAALWAYLCRVIATPAAAERRARQLRDRPQVDPRAELARLTAELARLDRAQALALDRHGRGMITDAGLDQHLARLATARATAAGHLTAAQRQAAAPRLAVAAVDDLEAGLARLRAAVELATPEQRRDLVRLLVPEAEIGDDALLVTVHLPAAVLGLSAGLAAPGLVSGPGYNSPGPSHRLAKRRISLRRAS